MVDGDLPGFLQAFGALHGVTEPAVGLRHAAGQIGLVGHQLLAQPGGTRHVVGHGIGTTQLGVGAMRGASLACAGAIAMPAREHTAQKTPPRRFITSLLINHPLPVKTH